MPDSSRRASGGPPLEDEVALACLVDLRRFELAYMDATLQTLLSFEKPNPNAAALATEIVLSRDYHD